MIVLGWLLGWGWLLWPLPGVAAPSAPGALGQGEPATLTVAHFAPFAQLESAVAVRLNGADVVSGLVYGQVAALAPLSATTYLAEVIPQVVDTVAMSASLVLTDGADYTLAAIGNGSYQNLELLLLVDDLPVGAPVQEAARPALTTQATQATVRLAHLAPFTRTLAATRVDLCANAGESVVADLVYKEVARFALASGVHELYVAVSGSDCATATRVVTLPSLTIQGGESLELYVVGDGASQPLDWAATTPLPLTPDPATLTVAHFAPFTAEDAASTVTVRVAGGPVLAGLGYGEQRAGWTLAPGAHRVELVADASETVLVSATLDLTGGMSYTLIATGNGTLQPVDLLLLEDGLSVGGLQGVSVAQGVPTGGDEADAQPKLRLAHVAPFAAGVEPVRIDVCTRAGVLVYRDLDYGEAIQLGFVPGRYDLKLVAQVDGCGESLVDLPPLFLAPDAYVELYAIGDVVRQPLSYAATTAIPRPSSLAPQLFLPIVGGESP